MPALTKTKSARVSDRAGRRLVRRGDTREIRARYDAAQTTDDNRKTWTAVDGLSADAANNLAVRSVLRRRGRYERANNSYLKGITSTLGNDTVGTGPRPQLLTDDPDFNSTTEEEWELWAEEIDLAAKLRTMIEADVDTGEVFLVFTYNPGLNHPVKLDVSLIEADQVTDPTWQSQSDPLWCDGIRYDAAGNAVSYRVLRQHPGSQWWGASTFEYDDVAARFVWHWFKSDRPGQRRGIPRITPSLPNWPELRRYCNAVIAAAETAADYAAIIYTDAAAEGEDDDAAPEAMDTIEIQKRMGVVMPAGWKAEQMRAEQPTTTYSNFVDKKLAEAARCINMPYTIAALDSSNSNLSARYLDSQIYAKAIRIDRRAIERGLNRLLDLWLTEAARITGLLGTIPDRIRRKWRWDSVGEHADPDKVASARAQRLKSGTSSHADECGDTGDDWEDVHQKAAAGFGVSVEEYRQRLFDTTFPAMQANGAPAVPTPPPGDNLEKTADDKSAPPP